jgi:DNA-binding winged helix-turn-helix (wHTH) protein/tetratricopeptide (TPR) repeat protein
MKLVFKSSLTDNCLFSSALRVSINRLVLPSKALGGGVLAGVYPKKVLYRFGPFELDGAQGTLSRNGIRVKLQDLPCRLLLMLVERHGEIVTREEVRQRLWTENTFVEFDGSLGVAIRKVRESLNDDANAPRYVETIPRRGYRFLAPVTVIDAEPNENGREAVATPEHSGSVATSKPGTENNSADTRSRSGYWIVALILLFVGATGYGLRSLFRQTARQTTTSETGVGLAPARMRRSVAVIGFRNLHGHPEDNWLSPAFAEMLNTELGADGALRMISGEDVARAKRELPLTDEDSLAQATLKRLRTDPGVDIIVLGSYTLLPGKEAKRVRLDVRLQDTARGETIAEEAFIGNENDLFELVSQAGASLRKSLGATQFSEEVSAQVRAALPQKDLAVQLYTQGQALIWAFDFVRARDLLIKAVAVEPEFPLAHAALSETWSRLGFTLKARNEAERAKSLSGHLGPEQRLLIEGQYYSSSGDTNKAIETYRKLYSQYPDNLDYGLRLADEQRRASPKEALKTVAMLRLLPSPQADDPRIDMIEARAWINTDFAKAQEAGRRAVEKGKAEGSQLLVARAYGILCQMIGNGVSTSEAIRDCDEARTRYSAAGDRNNEARALNDFAGLYYQLGQVDRSEKMYREAIAVFRDTGALDGLTAASSNLGDIFQIRGNLREAEKALSDALPGYNEMGDKDGVALTLNDIAEISVHRGDLDKAFSTYEKARVTAQEIDDKTAVGYILTGEGNIQADRGDLAAAEKSYDESLAIRKQIGQKQNAAETELALSQLAIEQGHAADAETVIRKCREGFHEEQQTDDELRASIVLIDALLAEAKVSEAENELKQAKPLAAQSVDKLLQLRFDLASARLDGALGRADAGIAQIGETLHTAHSLELLDVEFETRLTIVELRKAELKKVGLKKNAQQSAAAQAESLALEKAARKAGFILIANKAAALRTGAE